MNKALHSLIKGANDSLSMRQIAAISGFAKSTITDWASQPLRETDEEYVASPNDIVAFAMLKARLENTDTEVIDEEQIGYKQNEEGEMIISGSTGGRVVTKDELFTMFGLNQDEWDIKELTCTPYTTTMKLNRPTVLEDGRIVYDEQPHQHTNYSLRARLTPRREVVETIKSLDAILERFKAGGPGPVIHRPSHGEPHLLCLNIADMHLGKRAVDEGWGIDDAMRMHAMALASILESVERYNLAQILVWWGQDLLHTDSVRSQTTRGTYVESSASWYSQFDAAIEMGINTVDTLRAATNNVIVRHVPGNHSWHSEYGAASVLKHHFWQSENIEVHTSRNGRAMHSIGGLALLGTHGNNTKFQTAAMTMAIEYPNEWAAATCREVHSGHLHFKDGGLFMSSYQESNGVTVRQAPSLSPTDSWHSLKGYVGALQAMEGYLYNIQRGTYRATINAEI